VKRLSKEPHRIIYPQYLDSRRSRLMGRRVRKSLAVPMPTQAEMQAALEGLNMKFEIQRGKVYPRDAGKVSYRVVIFTDEPKLKLAEKIAERIGTYRGAVQVDRMII